ncbi:MAG: hypothetical protein ABI601_01295 [bacterium]
MRRLLLGRMVLTAIGIGIWGYGNAINQAPIMYAGMAVLAIALLLRFVPRRWFDDTTE